MEEILAGLKGVREKYLRLIVVGERNRRGKHHAITHSYLLVLGHSFFFLSLQLRGTLLSRTCEGIPVNFQWMAVCSLAAVGKGHFRQAS